jgi:polyribonucleotide nucleotidyltransferase
MEGTTSVKIELNGKDLIIETGLLAQQAAGTVTVTYGETVLFCAVTASKTPKEGIDYFPLQVEFRDKFYASGRFPGGFLKREGRPSEQEILTSRLTDRPIRPMFPEDYRNDVQIINMLVSSDGQNDALPLSMLGASAALVISEIPYMGPIAGIRVGRVNGEFVVNPTYAEMEESDLDLIYAGTKDLPLMIEGDAKELSEDVLYEAMVFAQEIVEKLIDLQLELREKLGLPVKEVAPADIDQTVFNAMKAKGYDKLDEALRIAGKLERQDRVTEIKNELEAELTEELGDDFDEQDFFTAFDNLEIEIVRKNVLEEGRRIDGRGFNEMREITGQTSVLPRPHGSAIFNRGETQALGIVTLGTKSDEQLLDSVSLGKTYKRFMLHYNFPPYSVGETGRFGMLGRREVGHGNLAERSLVQVLPDETPYTIRLVSEIMGSNGSSSMASICVGSLALMDAGIKIKAPVAGISVGLFSSEAKDELVIDILGAEDHCGDMDFKVAGTRNGITGFQMDLKILGLKWNLVKDAFAMAKENRIKILDIMDGILPDTREELSDYAPRVATLSIDPEKIGELIGPGGKNIRRITELSGAQIDIDEDGTVHVFATDGNAMELAVHEVNMIGAEAEEGKFYTGTVKGVKDFGAFVEVLPGIEGLVHISELADCRVRAVEDICKMGDEMYVKCIGIDDRGRVKLSRKAALEEKDESSND